MSLHGCGVRWTGANCWMTVLKTNKQKVCWTDSHHIEWNRSSQLYWSFSLFQMVDLEPWGCGETTGTAITGQKNDT